MRFAPAGAKTYAASSSLPALRNLRELCATFTTFAVKAFQPEAKIDPRAHHYASLNGKASKAAQTPGGVCNLCDRELLIGSKMSDRLEASFSMADQPVPVPDPNEKLVRVFDTEQDSEAMVVQGLLQSAGIDCQIGEAENTQGILPVGGIGLLVRQEDAARALQVIEEYRRSPEQEESEEEEFDESAEAAADGSTSEDR
jgi:putative signal transducing protein